jgi:transposase InsO family protein
VNEARKLVAQRDVLGGEICSILESGGTNREKLQELERHLADHSLSPNDQRNSATPPAYPIMTRHSMEHVYLKPRTPQLNGKVERSHRTDKDEFYQLLTY